MAAASLVLYSDFTCPFSHVTEAALRQILPGTGHRVEHRAFELYPAPVPLPAAAMDGGALLALEPLAGEVGVRLEPRRLVPRTRKAHEAARFAREHGHEEALRAAVYAAYWEEGRDIGRIDVLCALGEGVGLDPEEMKIALDIDAWADEVTRARGVAERAGVQHTPTLVLGGPDAPRWMIGAHPVAELRAMLLEGPDGSAAP